MRKQNPNDVVEDFQVLIAASLSTWTQMCAQISGNELRKNASVDALLNAAIGWESFLSDWHIAAINRDSGPFVVDLQARVCAAGLRCRFLRIQAWSSCAN